MKVSVWWSKINWNRFLNRGNEETHCLQWWDTEVGYNQLFVDSLKNRLDPELKLKESNKRVDELKYRRLDRDTTYQPIPDMRSQLMKIRETTSRTK